MLATWRVSPFLRLFDFSVADLPCSFEQLEKCALRPVLLQDLIIEHPDLAKLPFSDNDVQTVQTSKFGSILDVTSPRKLYAQAHG